MVRRGLRFGEVADDYHRLRPGYPRELFTELFSAVGLGDAPRALEVGSGTGKATVELAAVCGSVVAAEPDPKMADVARAVLRASPDVRADVRFELTTFEDAALAPASFDLVFAMCSGWTSPSPMSPEPRLSTAGGGIAERYGTGGPNL